MGADTRSNSEAVSGSNPMLDKIPDTPEKVLRAILATPPKKRDEWYHAKRSGRQ